MRREVSSRMLVLGGIASSLAVAVLSFGMQAADAMAATGPKVFAGSSDITAVHDALAARLDLVTILSPMVATTAFITQEATREHLRRTLLEPETVTIVTRSSAGALAPGRASGSVSP